MITIFANSTKTYSWCSGTEIFFPEQGKTPKQQIAAMQNIEAMAARGEEVTVFTNSPYIIAAVEDKNLLRKVWYFTEDNMIQCENAWGRDANWISERIFDVPDRANSASSMLEEIETAINEERYSEARDLLAKAYSAWGNDPELSRLDAALAFEEMDLEEGEEEQQGEQQVDNK